MVYMLPEPHDVATLMRALLSWINFALQDSDLPTLIIAGLAHYQFVIIYPYMDGNGRTARLLTTLILRKNGYGLRGIYLLVEHYAKNLKSY